MNYDPDSAGVAATERSLDLLLEEGFEPKVLALPAGLDPDAFVRKQGAEAYRERLAQAPTYLDYLTERAAATHDLSRPEGKVAAANAVLPYLVKIANRLLRGEVADRVAERLRLDDRLLREELRRAAGAGRGEIQRPADSVSPRVTPAERDLLRAFLEDKDLVAEFLPPLIEQGACEGLTMESILRQIFDRSRSGEPLDVTELGEALEPELRRLLFESLLGEGDMPDRDRVRAACLALERRRVERQREQLQLAIQAAERQNNRQRLGELLEAKVRLLKELAKLK
jgi:DNA primase